MADFILEDMKRDTITEGTVVSSKNSATGKIPVSKAGVASWNLVNQPVAKTASESMYNNANDSKVNSKLIDSYAWDTTCKWLMNSGIIKEENGKIDSTSYGNYNNSTFILRKGILYVKHLYLTEKNSGTASNWYYWLGGQGKYTYSMVKDESGMQIGIKTEEIVPSDATKPSGTSSNVSDFYIADGRIEIATGSSDETRTNNIYDLAGNMWEWTTETIKRKRNSDNYECTFAVWRGGGFSSNGDNYPIVYHQGNSGGINSAGIDIRVPCCTLYKIKIPKVSSFKN